MDNAYEMRIHVEEEEKWLGLCRDMPELTFRPDWKVKVIPPFGGAIIRFYVTKGDRYVSVYLDAFGRLGAVEYPYFEAYPIGDDCRRYSVDDVGSMMDDISKELDAVEYDDEPNETVLTCSDCSDDECTGHCSSCPYGAQ